MVKEDSIMITPRTWLLFAAAATILLLQAAPAQAQINRSPYSRNNQAAYNIVRDNTLRRPTVSPYLNLVDPARSPFTTPYHSLVRPLLEQEEATRRQQVQLQQVQQQLLQSEQRRTSRDQPGGIRGTGHATFYQNYSHFYPGYGR
jgi:hypothetical protein